MPESAAVQSGSFGGEALQDPCPGVVAGPGPGRGSADHALKDLDRADDRGDGDPRDLPLLVGRDVLAVVVGDVLVVVTADEVAAAAPGVGAAAGPQTLYHWQEGLIPTVRYSPIEGRPSSCVLSAGEGIESSTVAGRMLLSQRRHPVA